MYSLQDALPISHYGQVGLLKQGTTIAIRSLEYVAIVIAIADRDAGAAEFRVLRRPLRQHARAPARRQLVFEFADQIRQPRIGWRFAGQRDARRFQPV